MGQTKLPQELSENNRFHNFKITKVFASHQFSAALTDDNRLLLWGNANFADIGMDKELYDGHVVDAALTDTAYIVLLDDGSVPYSCDKATSFL